MIAAAPAIISAMTMLMSCKAQLYCTFSHVAESERLSAKTNRTQVLSYTTKELPDQVILPVQFTSQAPTGHWGIPYNEACEEASLAMVQHYLKNISNNVLAADVEIKKILQWENDNGYGIDVSAQQTLTIAQNVYGLKGTVYYGEDVTVTKIKELLAQGHPLIVPVAGQDLNNPNFRNGGPPYHMLVITGYDANNFITNEPGTSRGASYKYPKDVLFNALHDWAGSKSNARNGKKALLALGI